jgi:hypothetical protein
MGSKKQHRNPAPHVIFRPNRAHKRGSWGLSIHFAIWSGCVAYRHADLDGQCTACHQRAERLIDYSRLTGQVTGAEPRKSMPSCHP